MSVVVVVFASYMAFHLVVRLKQAEHRATKFAWLLTGAISMGGGVWSMHFIAMLAVRMRMEVRYDVTLSVISVIFAIIASTRVGPFTCGF